jgi:hypothetical protein
VEVSRRIEQVANPDGRDVIVAPIGNIVAYLTSRLGRK